MNPNLKPTTSLGYVAGRTPAPSSAPATQALAPAPTTMQFSSPQEAYRIFGDGVSSPAMKKAAYDYLLANPVKQQENNQQEDPPQAPMSGTGSGAATPDLSSAIEILRQNISSLDPIYQADVARAIQDYDIAMNERATNFNSAKASSEASGISNDQDVLTSRNAISKGARMSSEDIMSIIGALGMSGSTGQKAVGAIADKSNASLNEANLGYGKNKQSILQSWNDFVNKDLNQQKQIADAKEYATAQAGITRDTGKKNLLQQIASNKIEMGQSAQPEMNEMAGANANIANLSNVKRTYTGETPTYAAPSISSLLGQNLARFDISTGNDKKASPRLIKVNEQTATGDKYGL